MYAVGTNITLLQIDLLYEETRQQYLKKSPSLSSIWNYNVKIKANTWSSDSYIFVCFQNRIPSLGWMKALSLPEMTFIRNYRLNIPCLSHHLW